MTSEKPTDLVHAFFADLAQGRIDAALERVDDGIAYTNVSLPTVRGKGRFASVMRRLDSRTVGFDAQILAISADEAGVVLTERVDELRVGPLRIQFWVCGRNEIREGRIVLWRDYFDFWACTRGFVRALAAVVVPSLYQPLPGSLRATPASA